MLALLLSAILGSSSAPQDAKAFRAVFAQRRADVATTTPDPAIVKCMGIVAAHLNKEKLGDLSDQKVEQIVSFYARAVGDEEGLPTDFTSLSAAIADGPGVKAIGVRMGQVSSLRVYNATTGKPLPLPASFGWRFRFDTRPIFMSGGNLIVDGSGIQDAGIRYAYQIDFLSRSAGAFKLMDTLRGVWTLEDEADSHIDTMPTGFKLRTISSPKSFFTDNVTKLIESSATFSIDSGKPKRLAFKVEQPAVQAVDNWMANAIKAPKTEMERRFVAAYGKERLFLMEWSESILLSKPAQVSLSFDRKLNSKFDFTLKETARGYIVTDLKTFK